MSYYCTLYYCTTVYYYDTDIGVEDQLVRTATWHIMSVLPLASVQACSIYSSTVYTSTVYCSSIHCTTACYCILSTTVYTDTENMLVSIVGSGHHYM